MMLAHAWGFTAGLLSIVGLLSILLLLIILSDLCKIRVKAPDGILNGILILYGLATILAVIGLSFSMAISALSFLFG